jgi:PKD repeat protein
MRNTKRSSAIGERLPGLMSAGLAMAVINPAAAAELHLTWDPVPAAAGYKVHYGEARSNYTETVSVGNATSHTLTGLKDGREYCIAATAYDAGGSIESGFSNEVCTTIPGAASAPVASFDVTSASGQAPLTVTFTDTSAGDITGRCWDFDLSDGTACVDGGSAPGAQAVHTYRAAGNYIAQLTVTGVNGADSAQTEIRVTTPLVDAGDGPDAADSGGDETGAAADGFYRQDSSGLVVMEAEAFADFAAQPEHEWIVVTDPPGYVGDGAMLAWPDDGKRIDADYAEASPRLDFIVDFRQTGTHYVWLRALATGDFNNSAHVGLDYAAVDTADQIEVAESGDWGWTNDTKDGAWATLQIPAPGTYTINVWMREAGLVVDRVLLTTDADYVPTGAGPEVTGGAAAATGR